MDYSGCRCNDTTIAMRSYICGASNMFCASGSNCTGWNNMSILTICTDYSTTLNISSGEYYGNQTVSLRNSFSITFIDSQWFGNLYVGNNTLFYLTAQININIRPDGYINNSPFAITLLIVYKQINIQHVHVVSISDFDASDLIRCRWANTSGNINSANECGSVCQGVPNATLFGDNCTIVFTLSVPYQYAVVALQIEDYYNSASTIPISSTPLQFLFYGYPPPAGCNNPPQIIGSRRCIGAPIGLNVTEFITAKVFCPEKNIIEFISNSPIGMEKVLLQIQPLVSIYQILSSWVRNADQYGAQGFSVNAIDNTGVQSNRIDGPSLSYEVNVDTNITFWDSTNNSVAASFNCRIASEVTYIGFTISIRFPVAPWIEGHSYYVTFDSDAASGLELCGPQSQAITDPTFWVFNIWKSPVLTTNITSSTPITLSTSTTSILVRLLKSFSCEYLS
ncbi:unnamed protein product [Adineta ricciae]|uniref:Uncharacterized protein n=1 Tax=Adineta ricciae TaxID=249248 RepID=A0A815MET8_ADIRI|nr:unnamed protein product [Adineta ricciae]